MDANASINGNVNSNVNADATTESLVVPIGTNASANAPPFAIEQTGISFAKLEHERPKPPLDATQNI